MQNLPKACPNAEIISKHLRETAELEGTLAPENKVCYLLFMLQVTFNNSTSTALETIVYQEYSML